jgi:trimeric autotransporter adhesin
MKKILLLVISLMAANAIFAQIKYTDIKPDSSFNIKVSGTFSEDSAIYLDMDGDTKTDFHFKYQYISGFAGVTWKLQLHCADPNNEAYWKSTSTSSGNHFIKGLTSGDSISQNVLFGTDTDPLLGNHSSSNIIGSGDTYIGVKFVSGSKTYYGWILLNATYSGGSSGNITVKSYAYNSIPDEKIGAGDTCIKTRSTTILSDCDSVIWNGTTYNTSGTYTYTTTNSTGCDSIATLVFTKTGSSSTMNKTVCDSFELNGTVYYSTGAYKQVLSKANAFGCDSTINLNLTIKKSTTNNITTTACDSFTLNKTTYYATGNYTQILHNAAACDSIINLKLTINKSTSSTMTVTACDSFRLNGISYFSTGNYTQTINNTAGCDSIISLNLTINKSTSSTMAVTTCDSFKLNDSVYYQSGNYAQTITNAAGCDSIIYLTLIINKSTFNTINATACDSFKLNDSVYFQTGTYTQTIKNTAGCDSTIELHLTINHPSTNTMNVSACDSYTLNGTTYTTAGNYTQTLTNANGCDSIITLVLTIQTVNTNVLQNLNTLTAVATGLSYQWLDCNNNYSVINGATAISYTPTVNGDYAVEITDGACQDTSICYAITQLGIDNNFAGNVSVFPNPTNGNVLLNLGTTYTDVTISVSNVLGELITKESYTTAKEALVNINTAPGIYFITISTPLHSTRIKVIKQ